MMREASTASEPHLTTHDSKTAPKRRNAVVRGRHPLFKYGRRHGERLNPHPFQPSREGEENWEIAPVQLNRFRIAVQVVEGGAAILFVGGKGGGELHLSPHPFQPSRREKVKTSGWRLLS
jgi:hypothetical protein